MTENLNFYELVSKAVNKLKMYAQDASSVKISHENLPFFEREKENVKKVRKWIEKNTPRMTPKQLKYLTGLTDQYEEVILSKIEKIKSLSGENDLAKEIKELCLAVRSLESRVKNIESGKKYL